MMRFKSLCLATLIPLICFTAKTGQAQVWTNLGSGMDNCVDTLAVGPQGVLYAGGFFTDAGGVLANNIARWNPATAVWTKLGSGMDGSVQALAVGPQGVLYAGGRFDTAGGVSARFSAWTKDKREEVPEEMRRNERMAESSTQCMQSK